MAVTTILKADQTATPDGDVLQGKDWWGEYHILCTTYDSDDVVLQVRDPRESTNAWNDASFNGDTIQLTQAGAIFEVRLAQELEYRVSTAAAGAVVVIAPYTVKRNFDP